MGLNATPCMHDVDVCYFMVLSLFSDVFIRVPRAKLEARTSVNLEPGLFARLGSFSSPYGTIYTFLPGLI